MPRKLRLEYPGVIYRVMNRGDRREPIFKDDADLAIRPIVGGCVSPELRSRTAAAW